MVSRGCRGSIHGRWSSVDEASSFFEKVQLHFQLADLFIKLVFLRVGLLAHLLAAVAEDVGQTRQRLFLPTADLRNLHQHGWTRTRTRQRFYRTAVALAQVRTDLPRRLRQRPGSVPGAGELLPFLQLRTSAPGAGLSEAGGSVPAQLQKEEVFLLMGDAVPQTPWDLPLLFSRMDAFCFTRNGTCRTN